MVETVHETFDGLIWINYISNMYFGWFFKDHYITYTIYYIEQMNFCLIVCLMIKTMTFFGKYNFYCQFLHSIDR